MSTDRAKAAGAAVLLLAAAVAVASARPHADSANDGSRLAAVEALVDHHTLAIDESVFVRPPAGGPRERQPYPPGRDDLRDGTVDRIKVGDHFYSDKPYTPSLYLAGWYRLLQWATGLRARDRADLFCWWMTLLSSGVAYVVAVGCVYHLAGTVGLSLGWRLALAASFALGTLALPYCQHVNSHIVMLAVAAALVAVFAAADADAAPLSWRRALGLGTLAGMGYAIEQGVGQLLWGWALVAIVYRWGLGRAVAIFVAASLPWVALHHAVNYAIGGTFRPANAVPAYFDYPGSAFDLDTITGVWNHRGALEFLGYAGGLLVSGRGVLCFNLPLWLLVPGAVVLVRGRKAGWVAGFGATWALSTYLLYAALSTNFSGSCLSVRWFVPLLAPGFYALALLLHHFPAVRGDFLLLSGWGIVAGALMARAGPWSVHVPFFWPLLGMALASWAAFRLWRRRPLG